MGIDEFIFRTKLSLKEAEYIYKHIVDEGYSHDDFLKILQLENNKSA